MDPRVISRLLDAQATAQQRVEDHVARVVAAELRQFTGWYDEVAVDAISYGLGQRVMAAQRSSAALTDAYLQRVLADMLGTSPKPSGVIRITGPLRRGVTDMVEVYSRPAETYRYLRSVGYPDDAALSQAIDRLDAMARMDVELARREQTHETLVARGEVTGYRRMIRPYLSKTGTCGLCMAASNQKYDVVDLMPLHDRCKCEVLPITRLHDPGVEINEGDLEKLYEAAGSTEAARLKEVRTRVEDHGELGPRLVDARHRSKDPGARSPKAAPRSGRRTPARATAGGFDAMTRSQLENQLRITQGLKESEWRTAYLERLRTRLTQL